MESLLPLRLDVVTVLLLAVKAVNVLTSQRKIALSNPALATLKRNFDVIDYSVQVHLGGPNKTR